MAVHLTLSVLLIALLIGDIFCVPLDFYRSYTQGSGPAPVRSNVYGLPQFQPQSPETSQNPPPAPSQPAADTAVYMPEDPLNSPQPQGGMIDPVVFPPFVLPQPEFQAGELYQIEETRDFGKFQRESNEQYPVLPPPNGGPVLPNSYSGPSYSEGRPYSSPYGFNGGFVGGFSSIPFDFLFLTGQYPKGTFVYQSSSFEQGGDHNNDVHYTNLRPVGVPRYPGWPMLGSGGPVAYDDRRGISTAYSY